MFGNNITNEYLRSADLVTRYSRVYLEMPNMINSRRVLSILEKFLKRHAEEKVTLPDFCKLLSGKSRRVLDAKLEESKSRKQIVEILNEP